MKKLVVSSMFVAVALLLASDRPALAQGRIIGPPLQIDFNTVLVTPPLMQTALFLQDQGENTYSTARLFCNFVNVGKQPLQLVVTIADTFQSGNPISGTYSLKPGEGNFVEAGPEELLAFDVPYCKISFKGSKDDVRGALQQTYSFNGFQFPGPVVEAR